MSIHPAVARFHAEHKVWKDETEPMLTKMRDELDQEVKSLWEQERYIEAEVKEAALDKVDELLATGEPDWL